MANTPGVWTTKASDQMTLRTSKEDAAAACTKAAADTKGWQVRETESGRILVQNGPGFIDLRPYHVEVLLSDSGPGGTAVTLNGWTFGKGPGMKKMVARAVREFRSAIEEQSPPN